MTLTHWYRDSDLGTLRTDTKSKPMSRTQQVDSRLRSILLEGNPNRLLRQRAGLDKLRSGSRKRKAAAPRVFKFQQAYEQNRKQMQRTAVQAQRQLRKIQCHPVPNFQALHKRWDSRIKARQLNSLHNITEPKTPRTLLNSMKSSKRWQTAMVGMRKQQSREMTLRPKQSFDSWRRPPFVPRIWSSVIKTKPFQLKSEERGKQRKQFDMWNMREQQARWRLKAIDWARRCHAEYTLARKLTNFKAKPNPWKRTKAKI